MINKICKKCNKPFKVYKYRADKAVYCSYKCYWGEKITLKCKNCNKSFKKPPCALRYGSGIFCSQSCKVEFEKGKIIICQTCKKSFYAQRHRLKDNPRFCSRECYYKTRRAEYVVGAGGYLLVKKRSHPRANKNGYIQQHTLIAEKHLNRFLTKDEVIHHINKITHDNRPENLYLFPNRVEHMRYHMNILHGNCKKIIKSNII